MKLRPYKSIYTERKNIGILYHFTNMDIVPILKENKLKGTTSSGLPYKMISFTRDYSLRFADSENLWGDVRITIDGSKLSDRYKVRPFRDMLNLEDEDFKKYHPHYSESEEAVVANEIKDISKYILRIDILRNSVIYRDIEKLHSFLTVPNFTDEGVRYFLKDTDIPVAIVKDFKPYHRM